MALPTRDQIQLGGPVMAHPFGPRSVPGSIMPAIVVQEKQPCGIAEVGPTCTPAIQTCSRACPGAALASKRRRGFATPLVNAERS
jgi:hypothetical protein